MEEKTKKDTKPQETIWEEWRQEDAATLIDVGAERDFRNLAP